MQKIYNDNWQMFNGHPEDIKKASGITGTIIADRENELALSLKRCFASETLPSKFAQEQAATEYLSKAAQLLEELGNDSGAEIITMVLEKMQ